MGFLKKITRPISRVLDKVIPNEIKPALPFLAAAAPFMAPGIMGIGGNTMLSRALISGGLNLGSQLAQEGSEGDFSALSLALASGIGALSAPGTQGVTGVDKFGSVEVPYTTSGTQSAGDILRTKAAGMDSGITKSGLEFLGKGSDKLIGLSEGLAADGIFSKAGAKALSIPFTQGTMDLGVAETRRFNKQQIIDDALGALDEGADDAARASAIRLAMQQYGFTEDEITETIASAGYKAGGRVGLELGGGIGALGRMQDRKGESEDLDLMTIKATLNQVHTNNDDGEGGGMAAVIEFMEKNPEYKVEVMENIIGDRGDKIMVAPIEKSPVNILDQDGIKTIMVGDGIELIMPENKAKGGRVGAEEGGLMNLGGKEMDMRGGGFIPIGKKERADDVPARLSKNEFVMTADAVRAAGGGSVNKGAKRMYDLMNNLEARV